MFAPRATKLEAKTSASLTHNRPLYRAAPTPPRPDHGAIEQAHLAAAGLGNQEMLALLGKRDSKANRHFSLNARAKLFVGRENDPLEHEADRVAEQISAGPGHPDVSGARRQIRRVSEQLTALPVAAPAGVDRALSGPGTPLEPTVKQDMEQRFGHDFSPVRLHSDADAEQSARNLNAHAYTVGHDIVFARGRYNPSAANGRKLLAHELTHVLQQRTNAYRGIQRAPSSRPLGPVDPPLNKPADQIVRGVTYHPLWDPSNQFWDFVDDAGRSLYSTVVEGPGGGKASDDRAEVSTASNPFGSPLVQFWSAIAAVGVTEQAKKLAEEAVARLLREQGPKLAEMQKSIDILEKKGWQEELDGQTRRLAALNALEAERQAILDAYDPSVERSSQALFYPAPFIGLPYETSFVPLQGPSEPFFPQFAPDIAPDQGGRFGKYGGLSYEHDAVRSSVGDAYAYDIETDMVQVANDLERIARAGYTEIHIATGTHGSPQGGLDPEFDFLRQDARSILETLQRHSGLRIIPYNMANPVQAAQFNAMQSLAAEGNLPGGATIAAHCFSRTRVLDPNESPAGPYGSVELLEGRDAVGAAYAHGGLSIGFGALSVYGGLKDPNRTIGALKVGGGGVQILGGASYITGFATDSIGAVRFGAKATAVGGYITAPLTLVDFYRDMRHKFDPGVEPMKGEEAAYHGVNDALKLAGIFYPEAALAALAIHYGVEPVAEKGSEYLTPMFVGAISDAYGIPSQYVWGMK